jgi:hypothetical protein
MRPSDSHAALQLILNVRPGETRRYPQILFGKLPEIESAGQILRRTTEAPELQDHGQSSCSAGKGQRGQGKSSSASNSFVYDANAEFILPPLSLIPEVCNIARRKTQVAQQRQKSDHDTRRRSRGFE